MKDLPGFNTGHILVKRLPLKLCPLKIHLRKLHIFYMQVNVNPATWLNDTAVLERLFLSHMCLFLSPIPPCEVLRSGQALYLLFYCPKIGMMWITEWLRASDSSSGGFVWHTLRVHFFFNRDNRSSLVGLWVICAFVY